MKKIIILIHLILCTSVLNSKVKLPSILGDNMVLQQNTNVKLWGEASANKAITVKTPWDNKTYKSRTDNNGQWLVEVSTPTAGGPYEISISDGEVLTLKNVLIGEVWFCSGQSNMEMPMRGFDRQPMQGGNDVIAKAKTRTPIRIFSTDTKSGKKVHQFSKTPQTDCIGEWCENTPENVAQTSAVAYYFACYLQEVLEIPVGLVISTKGGSQVEAWMSREALEPFSNVDLSILNNEGEVKNSTSTPCVLYNAKIAPLTNFAIKGFLWYQGESNRHNAEEYEKLVPAFVEDLRKRWQVGEFPFYFVQIAPYNYEGADKTSAARLREAQVNMMNDVPNSGMVTTMDVGNPVFIHPVDKKTVGHRLAYWALGNTYGLKGFGYAPPIYKSMEIVDNKIYIDFNNAPHGISPMWTSLKGFEIAGEDKFFYPAFAEIETKTSRLAVSSDQVAKPVAVRYAYKNYIEPSIFSIHGIPVAPFRTDRW